MTKKQKKQFLLMIAFIMVFLIGNHLGHLIGNARSSNDLLTAINIGLDQLFPSLTERFFFPYISLPAFVGGLIAILALSFVIIYQSTKRKNFRSKEEHGSAEYADVQEVISAIADGNVGDERTIEDTNIILAKHTYLSTDTRKTFLNNNVCVIGGSGSGKTRFYAKPNILQMNGNYVLVDPKGSVCEETGLAFLQNEKDPYNIKIVNLVRMDQSMRMNPLKYIKQPNDVYRFVNNLVANTNKENAAKGDDGFFEKAEIAWLTAVLFYILAVGEPEEQNLNMVMELLNIAEASEEDESAESQLDTMFRMLDEANRMKLTDDANVNRYDYSFLAVRQYNLYRKAAGKTAKSILISVGVRLAIFNLPELQRMLETDELELELIGEPKVKDEHDPKRMDLDLTKEQWMNRYGKTESDYESLPQDRLRKTILYIIISDSDHTFSFLSSILLQQLYDMLYLIADSRRDHHLPIPVQIINDEFSNTGKQSDFEIKIATMRSRGISVSIILQNIAQLKNLYKDSWETIFGNCDTTLFLGGKEYSSLELLSKMIGNETVDYQNISETKGSSYSYSVSNQLVQRPLLAPDEIGRLKKNECLIHIRGQQIIRDEKYDLLKHKRIGMTSDADKKNFFDVGKYIDQQSQQKSTVSSIDHACWKEDSIGSIPIDKVREAAFMTAEGYPDYLDKRLMQEHLDL